MPRDTDNWQARQDDLAAMEHALPTRPTTENIRCIEHDWRFLLTGWYRDPQAPRGYWYCTQCRRWEKDGKR